MKKNSLKLLVCLYTDSDSQFSLAQSVLHYLLPDISESGRRSLSYLLEQRHYIYTHSSQGTSVLTATEAARATVRSQFPSLRNDWDSWEGDWSLLLFLQSSEVDPQFRNLRRVLVQEHAYPLKSGVYITPGNFTPKVIAMVESLYGTSVLIGSLKSWSHGFEPAVLFNDLGIFGIMDIYSGISKEVNQLLRSAFASNSLSNKEKKRLFLVFDQYIENLLVDPGFIGYYFSHSISSIQLLKQFQQLFSLVA